MCHEDTSVNCHRFLWIYVHDRLAVRDWALAITEINIIEQNLTNWQSLSSVVALTGLVKLSLQRKA